MGRKERINDVIKILEESDGELPFSKLYSKMALKHGTTERTLWDYLEILKAAERVGYPNLIHILQDPEITLTGEKAEASS